VALARVYWLQNILVLINKKKKLSFFAKAIGVFADTAIVDNDYHY